MSAESRKSRRDGQRSAGRKHKPVSEMLEPRRLLAAFNLATIAGQTPDDPTDVDTGFGVVQTAGTTAPEAGQSVAMLGRPSDLDPASIRSANNDDFQDILIGGSSQAFLWFGSAEAPTATSDWRNVPDDARVGNLGELGQVDQTPRYTDGAVYDYDGVRFVSSTAGSLLGWSVANAGDIDRDGLVDMLIGAPGINTVYLVFGSSQFRQLTEANKQAFNLDSPPTSAFRILKFVGTPISFTGASVAGVGNVFGGAEDDILIGAPDQTTTNFESQGAVYLISGTAIRNATPGTTFDLSTLGTSAGIGGVGGGLVITGELNNGDAGELVARGGDFNNDGVADFIIGDDGGSSSGLVSSAYVIYGGSDLNAIPNTGLVGFSLSQVGSTAANGISGAVFKTDVGTGYFAATSAGDFDNDGIDDIAIGSVVGTISPFGLVTLIYGVGGANALDGVFDLDALPATVENATFSTGSYGFGASLSSTRSVTSPTVGVDSDGIEDPNIIVNDNIDDLMIGDVGALWVIPGRTTTATGTAGRLTGGVSLTVNSGTGVATLNAMYLFGSITGGVSPTQAVSGLRGTVSRTTDGDNYPDIAVTGFGTIYVVEGGLLPSGSGGDDDDDDDVEPPTGAGSTRVYQPINLLPFGSRFVPTTGVLSKFKWTRVPAQARTQQYRPNGYYANRLQGGTIKATSSSKNKWTGYRTSTLGWGVATRGQFAKGLFDARKLSKK
jgi:hypothetical protein